MPVYIEKYGDLFGCYHSGTDDDDKKERQSYSANGPLKAEMSKKAFCDIKQKEYLYKSWDSFVNLFQKDKVLCCSSISKGKTGAPAVLTGIL